MVVGHRLQGRTSYACLAFLPCPSHPPFPLMTLHLSPFLAVPHPPPSFPPPIILHLQPAMKAGLLELKAVSALAKVLHRIVQRCGYDYVVLMVFPQGMA